MKKDKMTTILGFEPGKELRLMILKECRATGKSIEEITSQYQMPSLFIKDENGMIEYEGQKMTPAEFQTKYPWNNLITIE